ncbi:MAG: hypothetical protein ACTTJC_06495 [Campylobacter sp.]
MKHIGDIKAGKGNDIANVDNLEVNNINGNDGDDIALDNKSKSGVV